MKQGAASLGDQITERYYETTADRGFLQSPAHYERSAFGLYLRLKPWLPSDREARCLDLACGCGEVLYLLGQQGFRNTTGVDLCAEELERARPYVKGELVKAEVLDYLKRCASQSVDFVTALNFLEHLSKDTLLATLRELRRVLRPGGALVAMVPNAISPFGGLTRHWDMTHEWAFTPNNFRQLAALVDFDSNIEFRECGPRPHGILSGLRCLLWQAIRGGIAAWLLIEGADTKGGVYTMDMLVRMRVPK